MKAVHVLTIVDGLDDSLLVDMPWQGQLYDEAVHLGVGIQHGYLGEQVVLRDVILEAQQRATETASLAGKHLVLHVCLAATVVPHQDGCQMGRTLSASHHLLHLSLYLGFNLRRRGFSVNYLHRLLCYPV